MKHIMNYQSKSRQRERAERNYRMTSGKFFRSHLRRPEGNTRRLMRYRAENLMREYYKRMMKAEAEYAIWRMYNRF